MKDDKIINYARVDGVEVKMVEGKGRGVFAKRAVKKGELIAVEKALVEVTSVTKVKEWNSKNKKNMENGLRLKLIKKCSDIAKIRGIEALRLSYLSDG